MVVRAERALWLPGSEPPPHLDGSLPGDFGCAPAAAATTCSFHMHAKPLHACALLHRGHLPCPDALGMQCRFDPLGLGGDPDRLAWFAESERIHSRWAMLAVAGILVQVINFHFVFILIAHVHAPMHCRLPPRLHLVHADRMRGNGR